MKKMAKRKTVLTSLFLSCALALGGLFIGFKDTKTVQADTVTNGQYITVDTATTKLSHGTDGLTGLIVDSNVTKNSNSFECVGEYSGRINGVFNQGDADQTFKFSFPNYSGKYTVEWEFDFKIEDASGEGDYFLIKYYATHLPSSASNQYPTRIAVVHVDADTRKETFATVDYNGNVLNSKEEKNTAYVLPRLETDSDEGYFTLAWDENDVLSVTAPICKGGSGTNTKKDVVVAAFDKSQENKYGLPETTFPNGYKVSFTSNAWHHVLFTEIAGTSVVSEVTETPTWYTRATTTPTATVMLDGKVEKTYPSNTPIALPTARYLSNDACGDATLTVEDASGATVNEKNGLTAGNYTAVYTGGVEGATGNVQRIPFTVKDGMFTDMASKVISADGATAEIATKGNHTGILVAPTGSGMSGTINGIFANGENAEVEFLLPNSGASQLVASTDLVFRIEDAIDSTKYFELCYYYAVPSQTNGSGNTMATVRYVEDGVEKYVTYVYVETNTSGNLKKEMLTEKTTWDTVTTGYRAFPLANQDMKLGSFRLSWADDVLSVYVPLTMAGTNGINIKNRGEVAIAKFDGTTGQTPSVSQTPDRDGTDNVYGTPKMSFPNGYKISFTSANAQDVLFTSITGGNKTTDLALDFAAGTPMWYENYLNASEDVVAEIKGASLSLSTDIAVRFYVEKSKLDAYQDSKVEATVNNVTTLLTKEVTDVNGEAYYQFTLYGMGPHKMGDEITAVLYGQKADETELSALSTFKYSIATYCNNKLNDASASAELKALCTAILNYGSAAQNYKGYKTDALVQANYNATPEVPTYTKMASVTNEVDESFVWQGASLSLTEKVAVKFYFSVAEGKNVNTFHRNAVITYGDGKTHEIDMTGYTTETINGIECYVVTFDQMSAADLGKDITIKIMQSSTVQSETLTYSVEAYANNMTSNASASAELKAICVYLTKYIDAVNAYVAAN